MLDGMEKKADPEWDNPFIPGGELSREADEIVNLIKSGRPITPTGEPKQIITLNGNTNSNNNNSNNNNNNAQNNATATTTIGKETTVKLTQSQSIQPKITINGSDKNGATTKQSHVSKQTVPGPTSASHVVIDDKKNKNSGCCVIQ